MSETKETGKIEGANLTQFFLEITGKLQAKQALLLNFEAEYEHTENFERIFRLFDNVLTEISTIEEKGLESLTKKKLFELNERADRAILDFEETYGNKTNKATTRPN